MHSSGIILASLSQSLQCLIVAPRLLQNMAKDGHLAVHDVAVIVTPSLETSM